MTSKKSTGRGKLGAHVGSVVKIFNDFYHANERATIAHIEAVKKSGDYKNLESRIAFDMARATKYRDWPFLPKDRQGYIAATDKELETLLLQALRKSDININKTPNQTTMPKKRTKPTKATAVTKKAVAIYDEQKATYQKMLKTKVRQGKKVTTAAKEASKTYKELYGATPTARWKRALREAKNS